LKSPSKLPYCLATLQQRLIHHSRLN